MSARSYLRLLLVNDPYIASQGVVAEAIISGDVDTPEYRPFIQFRWGPTTPGLDVVDFRSVVIWVHDEPGDYTRIDGIIKRIRYLFSQLPLVGEADLGGGFALACEWVSDSDDLTDDGHGTITRTTTHTLVGSGL